MSSARNMPIIPANVFFSRSYFSSEKVAELLDSGVFPTGTPGNMFPPQPTNSDFSITLSPPTYSPGTHSSDNAVQPQLTDTYSNLDIFIPTYSPDIDNHSHEVCDCENKAETSYSESKFDGSPNPLDLTDDVDDCNIARIKQGLCLYNDADNIQKKLLQEAKDDVSALYKLGWIFYSGEDIHPNFSLAKYYFEKALCRGYIDALSPLALIYQYGKPDVSQNLALAAQYRRIAAEKKLPLAIEELEQMYIKFPDDPDVIYHATMIIKTDALKANFTRLAKKEPDKFDKLSEQDSFKTIEPLLIGDEAKQQVYRRKLLHRVFSINKIPDQARKHIFSFLVFDTSLPSEKKGIPIASLIPPAIPSPHPTQAIPSNLSTSPKAKSLGHLLLSWLWNPKTQERKHKNNGDTTPQQTLVKLK